MQRKKEREDRSKAEEMDNQADCRNVKEGGSREKKQTGEQCWRM